MKQQKKGKFFTFVFSFMPGAAEMYMGFMKCGLSLMALFLGCIALSASLFRGIEMIPVFAAILVWFYSFFHARNLAALPEGDFALLSDTFIWEGFVEGKELKITSPTIRKWAAGILIVLGAVLLWDNFSSLVYSMIPDRYWGEWYPIINRVPQVVIAVLIIIIGLKLMAGKKEEINGDER